MQPQNLVEPESYATAEHVRHDCMRIHICVHIHYAACNICFIRETTSKNPESIMVFQAVVSGTSVVVPSECAIICKQDF